MLFTSPLFSMIKTTSTQGFTQLVDDDSHYFIQRASAQGEEIADGVDEGERGEPAGEATPEQSPPKTTPTPEEPPQHPYYHK